MAARTKKPSVVAAGHQHKVYQFESLPVGGSFLVEDKEKWNSVRSSASRKSKELNRKFKVTMTDKGILVTRLPKD